MRKAHSDTSSIAMQISLSRFWRTRKTLSIWRKTKEEKGNEESNHRNHADHHGTHHIMWLRNAIWTWCWARQNRRANNQSHRDNRRILLDIRRQGRVLTGRGRGTEGRGQHPHCLCQQPQPDEVHRAQQWQWILSRKKGDSNGNADRGRKHNAYEGEYRAAHLQLQPERSITTNIEKGYKTRRKTVNSNSSKEIIQKH